MDKKQGDEISRIVEDSGLLSFIHEATHCTLVSLETSSPKAFSLLSEKARDALEKGHEKRLRELYKQVLNDELIKEYSRLDPLGMFLGSISNEDMAKAAKAIIEKACGTEGPAGLEAYLNEKYPLLSVYRETIDRNILCAYSEFLDRVVERKEEIEKKLLSGRKFTQILDLSTGGADVHRHGRCVIGVETDGGSFFYKPHDCGPDKIFEIIVGTWFSECTIAPAVLEGDGYAFVSALEKAPLESESQVSEFYHNFGKITAIFHALGSLDMHQENFLACGNRPAAVDLETLLVLKARTEEADESLDSSTESMLYSVFRIGILPTRNYGVGFISALYPNRISNNCLPVFDGRTLSAEGHEKEFEEGFSIGYDRMLSHREEIKRLIEGHRRSTVRLLFKNTAFYVLVRRMLYQPKNLISIEERDKVYTSLCSPYITAGVPIDEEITRYEWESLLEGDVPYFCTSLDSYDICGEDAERVVKKKFYKENVLESESYFLDRLCDDEKRFEMDLMRFCFAHKAPDIPEKSEEEAIGDEPVSKEEIVSALADIYENLKKDSITGVDGSAMWMSLANLANGMTSCDKAITYAELGFFFSMLSASGLAAEGRNEIERDALMCANLAQSSLERWHRMPTGDDKYILPIGLYNGIGSFILSSHFMAREGIESAESIEKELLELLATKKFYRFKKNSLSEGAAGLLIALSMTRKSLDSSLVECIHHCADSLVAALPMKGSDENAASGAALAGAYVLTGEDRYREGAEKAFAAVLESYSEVIKGWPESASAKSPLMKKGPYAAEIYLAADFAGSRLESDAIERVGTLAKQSILEEKRLLHRDCLDQGNALTVLALARMGETELAGRVIETMIRRKKESGDYTIMKNGVKNFFDSSISQGTVGIGLAMIIYLQGGNRL